MAALTIDTVPQHYGLLRRVSQPALNDNALAELSFRMFQTLDELNMGRGLSAIQVGVPARMFIMDASRKEKGMGYRPRTLVNPLIVDRSKETITSIEGCLSIPDTYEEPLAIVRHKWIKIRYATVTTTLGGTTYGGETVEEVLEGTEAILGQHEMDHLNGILITDIIAAAEEPFQACA